MMLILLLMSALEKRYNVWYHHSGLPPVSEIPTAASMNTLVLTSSEVLQDVGDNCLTHLYLWGDGHIPAQLLSSGLQQLWLSGRFNAMELER